MVDGQAGGTFFDYERGGPLLFLAVLFVAAVVAVAGWKGVAALAGLAVALSMVWLFTLPSLAAVQDGTPPGGPGDVVGRDVRGGLPRARRLCEDHDGPARDFRAGIAVVAALAWWAIPATSLTPRQDEVMVSFPTSSRGSTSGGSCCAAWCWPGSAC